MISKERLLRSMDYTTFRELTRSLLDDGKTTGPNQTPAYIEYTRLNQKRMDRLDKKLELTEDLKFKAQAICRPMDWLILVESWCGDVAQNLPVIAKIADLNDNINLRILLRDENLDIMDQYLTNGGRGIPKLVVFDQYMNELASWGPRPTPVQDLLIEYKENGKSYQEYSEQAHRWYAKDKTITLQKEMENLLDSISAAKNTKAA